MSQKRSPDIPSSDLVTAKRLKMSPTSKSKSSWSAMCDDAISHVLLFLEDNMTPAFAACCQQWRQIALQTGQRTVDILLEAYEYKDEMESAFDAIIQNPQCKQPLHISCDALAFKVLVDNDRLYPKSIRIKSGRCLDDESVDELKDCLRYAQEHKGRFACVKTLTLPFQVDQDISNAFPNLETLDSLRWSEFFMAYTCTPSMATKLSKLESLKKLTIMVTYLENDGLEILAKHPSLQSLMVEFSSVQFVKPPNLQALSILPFDLQVYVTKRVTDLSPLQDCKVVCFETTRSQHGDSFNVNDLLLMPNLQQVSFHDVWIPEPAILDVLKQLPHLKYIEWGDGGLTPDELNVCKSYWPNAVRSLSWSPTKVVLK